MKHTDLSDITPQISVVIPCHNAERYLAETISSVESQSVPVHEIVVVDDCSTDRTVQVAQSFSSVTKVIQRAKCGGAGSARNDGIRESSGHWIALLDSDDLWHKDKLANQIQSLDDKNRDSILTCMVKEFISSDADLEKIGNINLRNQTAAIPSTMLFSRQTFERIGEFQNNNTEGVDTIHWTLQANRQNVKFVPVESAIVFRRIHDTNTGRMQRSLQQAAYLREIKHSLDKKRLQT